MDAPVESLVEEVTRLRGCLNDLVSIMALSALWAGEPGQIISTLLDALLEMLHLEFVFVRLNDIGGAPTSEIMRVGASLERIDGAVDIGHVIDCSLGNVPLAWPPTATVSIGGEHVSAAFAPLGLQGEIGILGAGSRRFDFSGRTGRLLLDIAANRAAVGLQQARPRDDSQLVLDTIPGLVALLTADGGVEVVNRQILDYSGQTLEELRQWATTDIVHPEDLPHVAAAFSQSIATGTPYEIVQRFRRSDGVYRWFLNCGFPFEMLRGKLFAGACC